MKMLGEVSWRLAAEERRSAGRRSGDGQPRMRLICFFRAAMIQSGRAGEERDKACMKLNGVRGGRSLRRRNGGESVKRRDGLYDGIFGNLTRGCYDYGTSGQAIVFFFEKAFFYTS